jgi:hypothetical protein
VRTYEFRCRENAGRGDRAKYIGIVIGLTFASLLITQRSAIFVGITTHTFSFLTDTGLSDVWVVEPQVHYFDIKPLKDTKVLLSGAPRGFSRLRNSSKVV